MVKKDIALVFDCGATNLRVIAMDNQGRIKASASTSNHTSPDPEHEGGLIWDVDSIWQKLIACSRKVMKDIDASGIAGVTVTTFGVDGTFVDADGKMCYPVISWQCERTVPVMEDIEKYIPLKELYAEAGTYPHAINTINKFIWLKENRPDVIDHAHRFLFISSLFIFKLAGVMQNDSTMAGTSMLMDMEKQQTSERIFRALGMNPGILGDIALPGDQAGNVQENAAAETGIPAGTPVFFAGHDTQFALFGSGATENELVLSSGTWEIIMARSSSFQSGKEELNAQLTTEADAEPGLYNIGQNYLASGVLEWFAKHFYPELKGDKLYETMIEDAASLEPGNTTVRVNPAFSDDGSGNFYGSIVGLTLHSTRGEIYRAFLEGLAFRLKSAVEALESAGGFEAEKIICVGGGSKNQLWNQLRADVCNVPILLIDQKETTVLGAALFVFAGSGVADSLEEARNLINYRQTIINPSEFAGIYQDRYIANKEILNKDNDKQT